MTKKQQAKDIFLYHHKGSLHRLEAGRNAPPADYVNPLKWGDAFTEGNIVGITLGGFHDPQGLIYLMEVKPDSIK